MDRTTAQLEGGESLGSARGVERRQKRDLRPTVQPKQVAVRHCELGARSGRSVDRVARPDRLPDLQRNGLACADPNQRPRVLQGPDDTAGRLMCGVRLLTGENRRVTKGSQQTEDNGAGTMTRHACAHLPPPGGSSGIAHYRLLAQRGSRNVFASTGAWRAGVKRASSVPRALRRGGGSHPTVARAVTCPYGITWT
jgi:hypothetical protein